MKSFNNFIKTTLLLAVILLCPLNIYASRSHSSEHKKSRHFKISVKNKIVTGFSTFPCPPVDNTPDDHPIINSEVEPTVAAGPQCSKSKPIVVIGYQQDRYTVLGGCNDNYFKISTNGGKKFGNPIPYPTVLCFEGPFERDTDPRFVVTNTGKVFFCSVPYNNDVNLLSNFEVSRVDPQTNEILYTKYLDQEDLATSPFATTDYGNIIADPQDKTGNTVYASWTVDFFPANLQELSQLKFSKTTDGNNWSTPIAYQQFPPSFTAPFLNDASSQDQLFTLLRNPGKNYSKIFSFFNLTTGANNPAVPFQAPIYSTISLDQGETWSEAAPLGPFSDFPIGKTVDPSNTTQEIRAGENGPVPASDLKRNILYVVTQLNSLIFNGTPSGIFLFVSTDEGNTWTKFGPLNRDITVQAFTPSISVLENGLIAISYYDFRKYKPSNDLSLPLSTDRWLDIYSYHHGEIKFLKEARLTEKSFNMRKAPALGGALTITPPGLFLGDYQEQIVYKNKIYHTFGKVSLDSNNNQADIQLSIIKIK